ncbi:MAG: DUF4157 domain-containing protein, partial [Methylococcales bacterium]
MAFGSGHWRPETAAGRHLLAHELTHVVQQRGTRPAPISALTGSLAVGVADSRWEQEAQTVAGRVASSVPASTGSEPVFRSAGGVAGTPLLQRAALESGSPASKQDEPVPSASKQDASVLPATAQNAPVLPWKDTILDGVVFTTRQEPDG